MYDKSLFACIFGENVVTLPSQIKTTIVKRVAIYGGSFNPVHFGHTGLAEWVLRHTPIDEIWMMVSPNNPLKDPHILADEQQRINDLRLALAKIGNTDKSRLGEACIGMDNGQAKWIKASDFEFGLPRPNYTANTLRELSKRYPNIAFSLLIGEDNWDIFTQWREWQFIAENYPILVYPRHGEQGQQTLPEGADYKEVTYLKGAPYFDVSSTEIRRRKTEDRIRKAEPDKND